MLGLSASRDGRAVPDRASPHNHKATRAVQPQKAATRAGRRCSALLPIDRQTTCPKTCRGRPIWKAVLDELDPLCCQFDLLEDDASNIAGGPRQTCDVATGERIVVNGN